MKIGDSWFVSGTNLPSLAMYQTPASRSSPKVPESIFVLSFEDLLTRAFLVSLPAGVAFEYNPDATLIAKFPDEALLAYCPDEALLAPCPDEALLASCPD